jgi:hypothetical protein
LELPAVKQFQAFAPRQLQVMALLERAYPMPMTAEAIGLEIGCPRFGSLLYAMRLAGRVVHLGTFGFAGEGGRGEWCAIYGRA